MRGSARSGGAGVAETEPITEVFLDVLEGGEVTGFEGGVFLESGDDGLDGERGEIESGDSHADSVCVVGIATGGADEVAFFGVGGGFFVVRARGDGGVKNFDGRERKEVEDFFADARAPSVVGVSGDGDAA